MAWLALCYRLIFLPSFCIVIASTSFSNFFWAISFALNCGGKVYKVYDICNVLVVDYTFWLICSTVCWDVSCILMLGKCVLLIVSYGRQYELSLLIDNLKGILETVCFPFNKMEKLLAFHLTRWINWLESKSVMLWWRIMQLLGLKPGPIS